MLRSRRLPVIVGAGALLTLTVGVGLLATGVLDDDPCARLSEVDTMRFATFGDQQRAQAEAFAACLQADPDRTPPQSPP